MRKALVFQERHWRLLFATRLQPYNIRSAGAGLPKQRKPHPMSIFYHPWCRWMFHRQRYLCLQRAVYMHRFSARFLFPQGHTQTKGSDTEFSDGNALLPICSAFWLLHPYSRPLYLNDEYYPSLAQNPFPIPVNVPLNGHVLSSYGRRVHCVSPTLVMCGPLRKQWYPS
ncbi:hypothetical protein K474DRAFT_366203 [Panus rudis PR-1116 ss-1]|nr:hypothetical protein K474DRAFT_366203 [Panus rudis PR-1116 ss-1]